MPSRDVLVTGTIPQWLTKTKGRPNPNEIIVCTNGLLHLATQTLIDSTPEFFAVNAVDYAYDPDAEPPKAWLQFLKDLFGDDSRGNSRPNASIPRKSIKSAALLDRPLTATLLGRRLHPLISEKAEK